jgi:DNA-binding transcriptional LysR family regulator
MMKLRDLEIRHLAALEAVARLGTFGRAGDELGYTQSAISQQIAAFERLIGAPLFDRPGGPRPVTLTPLGERMLDHARTLLTQVDSVASDVDEFRHGAAGALRIGTFESMSTSLLPDIVGLLLRERPKLDISLHEWREDEELLGALRSGKVDLSFAVGQNGEPGELTTVPLLSDPYVVVSRAEQASAPVVRPADLVGLGLIGDQNSACQRLLDEGLEAIGVVPSYVFRSGDNAAIVAMVRAGLGTAIMPSLAVDSTDSRIAVRPIVPPIKNRQVCLSWRANRTLSPAAERFVELAKVVAGEWAATARTA